MVEKATHERPRIRWTALAYFKLVILTVIRSWVQPFVLHDSKGQMPRGQGNWENPNANKCSYSKTS
jgi:hypothetical protein